MSAATTLQDLLEQQESVPFGQVLIRRQEKGGYTLQHLLDERAPIRAIQPGELRQLVQFTESGAFRPLKSAPNLRRGWQLVARDWPELELFLNQIYPGSVADYAWARAESPPITSYRDFTARQTGMYRITARLEDPAAGLMARACCHPRHCLKQRLWTVGGLGPDSRAEKSLIPCLEPCALLLEFARNTARLEQEPRLPMDFGPSEGQSLLQAVKRAAGEPSEPVAEADFNHPANPRRLQLAMEKLALLPSSLPPGEE